MTVPPRRAWLSGALTLPVVGLGLVALSVPAWPDLPGLRTAVAILDSLVPHLAAAALLGAAGLWLAGLARRGAALAAALALLAGGGLAARHLAQSAPPAADPAALTVLWFNMLTDNPTPMPALVAALAASPADVVLIAEPAALRPHLPALAAHFPLRSDCPRRGCPLLVLGRGPAVAVETRPLDRAGQPRLALVSVAVPGRAPAVVAGVHLLKPWYFGFVEAEEWFLRDALRRLPGPLLLTGDFNAAPWSGRVQALVAACGFALPRRPVPTWPAAAGPVGVPIDLALLRGGATPVSVTPWGAGLGSNHLGLLTVLALPPEGRAPAPVPPDCRPVGPSGDRPL